MSILITGANGQLGTELIKLLPNAIATGRSDLDITNEKAVHNFVKKHHITMIVNCAAYTNVDAAETNVRDAVEVNVYGAKYLAQTGKKIIHISTDYVFDGDTAMPYKPKDLAKPLSVYGYTKFLGEKEILRYSPESIVLRTSWVYSPHGNNFFTKMQQLGAQKSEIDVIDDQVAAPTYAADLAAGIVEIIPQINESNSGIYHFANKGSCSRRRFASEIIRALGLDCKINPVSTSTYMEKFDTKNMPAKRPAYSVLDTTLTTEKFGLKIPSWEDALDRCLNQITR